MREGLPWAEQVPTRTRREVVRSLRTLFGPQIRRLDHNAEMRDGSNKEVYIHAALLLGRKPRDMYEAVGVLLAHRP